MTEFPNQEGLNKAFNIYRAAMRKFIISRLKQIPGTNIESVVIDSLEYRRVDEVKRVLAHSDRNIESAIDINDFPHLVHKNWREAFEVQLNDDKTFRNQLWLIVECRNADWAHPPEGDAESEGTRAHLFLIADVLGKINESDAKRVREIRDQLFSHEAEEHPAEVENIAYKEQLADMTKQLDAEKSERTELEKRLKTTSDRLKDVERERDAHKKHMETISDQLATLRSVNAQLEERLETKSTQLEDVETVLTACKEDITRTLRQLEGTKEGENEQAEATQTSESGAEEKKKAPKPRVTFREKFAESTPEEKRIELANKVAELRLDPDATRAMAWRKICKHEDVILKRDEFHKIIKVSDYYKEAVLERLAKLIDEGWVYKGSLKGLCGFDVPEKLVKRMEKNKVKVESNSDGDGDSEDEDSETSKDSDQ